MRLIHTSDWHLGRAFHGVGLLDAQARFVDHLVEAVRTEGVDAVLVSGDVYDRALPSPATVELLSEAVTRVIDAGAQVVLSSGNHDSAIRLGFAARLLERAGLHIRTALASVGSPVTVDGVSVYALPYLEPSTSADPLEATERTHAGVLRAAMARVEADLARRGGPSVVMAHAFVTGAASCESERDISVGGVSAVHPSVFQAVDYVALGHLHGAQRVSEHVHYSGSPLAMSFSEHRHTKGSWLVELDDAGVATSRFVAAPVDRPLRVLRGDLDELMADPALDGAAAAYCQVTLTDPVRPLGAMDQLRQRFPHTLQLAFEPRGGVVPISSYAAALGRRSDDLDVCCDFLAHVRGGHPASAQERGLFAEAVEASRVERAHRLDELGAMLPGLGDELFAVRTGAA
ncbi:MAG: exonuclease SbcCD subunit D [Actinomycetota bacterium]|nr:exonuclease SbcCD subunit D [Actinomycetota bacterium]